MTCCLISWLCRYAAAAKSLQSCPTLCDPREGSPPGSPAPAILQARTLEWVAISFSNAWKWKVKVKSLSRVRLLETPWTAAYQALPSMGFSRQEYWSGVPLPAPIVLWKVEVLVAHSCLTLCDPWTVDHQASLWDSPGKNTRVGCHSLLQGSHPNIGMEPISCIGRWVLYH